MTDTMTWPSPSDLTMLPRITVDHDDHSWLILGTHAADHIFSTIETTGTFYEYALLAHLEQFVTPGDYVVDVGANIGNHTVWFAGVLGCRVRSFEPMPVVASVLTANVQLNGLDDRVRIEPYGVGSRPGTAEVARHEPGNTGATRLRPSNEGALPVVCLDDLTWDEPVALLKVDVEGMEPQVLTGARNLISRDRPVLVLEVQDTATDRAVRRWLSDHDYLVLSSFNATPTLVAVPRTGGTDSSVLTHVASTLEHLGARFDEFEKRLDRLARYSKSLAESGGGITASSRQDGGDNAVIAALRRRIDELENTIRSLHDQRDRTDQNPEDH